MDEYFWKYADLTGQELHLRQFVRQVVPEHADSVGNDSKAAWLRYIKLVPLRGEQVRALEEERRGGRQRRLFGHHDAWSYTYEFRPTRVADIQREIEPFRDTDFARLYWECGMGDRMYYPSKLGLTAVDDWIEDPYRQGDRLAAETWQAWRKQGIDPFRTALDYAKSLGLEFMRPTAPPDFIFPCRKTSGTRAAFTTGIPSGAGGFAGVRASRDAASQIGRLGFELRHAGVGIAAPARTGQEESGQRQAGAAPPRKSGSRPAEDSRTRAEGRLRVIEGA